MKTKYEAILETLEDILPSGAAVESDDAGSDFGVVREILGQMGLKANLGPGTLSYKVIGENGETISWDLESVKVSQSNGELLFTGVIAEMQ